MRRASEKGYLVATDLADYLVQRGMTFRQAHKIVGQWCSMQWSTRKSSMNSA